MANKGESLKIQFSGDYKDFKKFIDKKKGFPKELEHFVKKATIKNSLIMVARIRQGMRGRKFEKNAKVTNLIKGNKSPTIDESHLHNAIAREMIDSFTAKVGVLDGQMARIAKVIHEGATLKITPKMRAAIFGQLRERGNLGKLDPNHKSDGFMRIKPRPFLSTVFESPTVRKELNQNWQDAVEAALQVSSNGKALKK
jgi:hypothetical protein